MAIATQESILNCHGRSNIGSMSLHTSREEVSQNLWEAVVGQCGDAYGVASCGVVQCGSSTLLYLNRELAESIFGGDLVVCVSCVG